MRLPPQTDKLDVTSAAERAGGVACSPQGALSRAWQGGVVVLGGSLALLLAGTPASRRERGASVLPMHGVVYASDETGKVL